MSMDRTSAAVDLVTSDQELSAHVREISAEAGLSVNVVERASVTDSLLHRSRSLVLVDSRSWDLTESSIAGGVSAVMLAVEPGDSAWDKASICGFNEVISWPHGAGWLAHRLEVLAADSGSHAEIVAVVGARGGCGASTLAVSLAAAAAGQGAAPVLIDADSHSRGLSRSLGIADGEGLRWADFAELAEPLTAGGVRGQLAECESFPVLTGPWGPGPVAGVARKYAIQACELAYDLVVVDLPRYELASAGVSPSANLLLVTTLEVRSLMTSADLLTGVRAQPSPAAVVRSDIGPVPLQSAQGVLAPAVLHRLKGSRGISGAADFGDLGAAVKRGSISVLAEELVMSLLEGQAGGQV